MSSTFGGGSSTTGRTGSMGTSTTGGNFGGGSTGAGMNSRGGTSAGSLGSSFGSTGSNTFGGANAAGGAGGMNRGGAGNTFGATGGTAGLGMAGGTTGGIGNPMSQSNRGATQAGAQAGTRTGVFYSTVLRFPTTPVAPTQIQANLQDVFARSTTLSAAPGLKVGLENGVVVLRGNVADEEQRRIAENMVRLNPGVREVKNELVVK